MVMPHWSMPQLFPREKFADYKMPKLEDVNHYTVVGARLPGRRDDDVELRLCGAADGGGLAGRRLRFGSRKSS